MRDHTQRHTQLNAIDIRGQAPPPDARSHPALADSFQHEGAAFGVGAVVAIEACGDALILRGVLEEVASELFDQEAIVGLVLVEGVNDVVAVAPDQGLVGVAFIAVRLRVAHQVEPVATPANAVVGGGQQAIDDPIEGAVVRVREERSHLLLGRRQTRQVVGDAT